MRIDGTMFMHHERLASLLKLLDPSTPGFVGAPRRITSAFSFPGDAEFFSTNIRIKKGGDPLGCVGDLGWYCIRLALVVFRWEAPTSVRALQTAATDGEGVPIEVSAEVYFGQGKERVLSLHCSFRHSLRQWFEIETDGGKMIRCDDFVIPTAENGARLTVLEGSLTPPTPTEHASGECCQEACMWDALAGLTRGGGDPEFWGSASLSTQAVADAIIESCAAGNVEVQVRKP
jgi:predicted dehydrogenase